MANNKWKRILSLVMSLLMMLPGAAFADETGVPYSAEDHALLTGYVELLSDGFGLNEMDADYAKAIENVVREEIGGQNADGGPLWYAADPMTGWGVENTLEYSFEGGLAEGLAEISLRVERGADGSALVIALGEGEEVSLPMSNLSGQLNVYAYAVGTEEEPKLMVGAIGAWDFSNAVILARNGETGAWEIEMQVTTEGDAVLLNGDVAHAQVDTDGTIWLDGDNGASIVFISGGESRICRIDEYGEMISEEVAPADADDPAAGREDLADALRLAARCSILWGKSGEDSVSLQDMIDNAVCVLCGGKGQHLAHPCGAHCILEEGDHGECEICGEPLCVSDNHGTAEGECGYITAGPSKAPGVEPTPAPTVKPTVRPTAKPTEEPGVEAPSLPMEGVCPVCRQPDNGVSHQAECGHFTCAADWGDIRHGYWCPGCGLLSCSEEYIASGKNHVACPGCGIYDCMEEYGEFSHPACAKCGAYFCVDDESNHSYCPGCDMFYCEEGYNKDILHEACPGCGAWNCVVDMSLIDHGNCPCCGMYACEDGYVYDEHSMCPGCGMYLCDPNYAAEEHKGCDECNMKVCDADYIPEKHTVCEACGEMLCNGEDHSQASCGFSGHYVCVGKHGQCPKCGELQCDGNGHEPCPNPRCDAYSCDDDYVPKKHAGFACGKHFVCDYTSESAAPNPNFHAKANCGVHYQCEDGIHETCDGCGVYLCGEGIDLAEHEWCYNCEVYFCEEEYAHIIHHYYDDGDCRCTLMHDSRSAAPCPVGEEGVQAHFALDCCGRCSMLSYVGMHGLPADCGKEGHIKCNGRHDACEGCGMFECDERFVDSEHDWCYECRGYICNGANHSQAPCGHYYCVIGENTAGHNGCSGCGRYACSGDYYNYTHNCPECGECYLPVHATPHTSVCACGDTMCSITDPSEHAYCSVCKEYICTTSGKEAHAEMSCGHKACKPADTESPAGSDPRHTQICEHCGKYMCINRMGGHNNLYDCGMHWTCVGAYDSRRHEKLPCGVHSKCEVNESEWALHGACGGGCGTKLCQIDEADRPLHAICAFCGLYLCSENHFVSCAPECENPLHCGRDHTQEHYMCYGCGLYLCDPAAADLIHNTAACGHWTCKAGYVPAEHAYHEACGKFICDGGNHEPCPDCGECPEDTSYYSCPDCGKHATIYCVCDKFYCGDCYYSHQSTCPGFSMPFD